VSAAKASDGVDLEEMAAENLRVSWIVLCAQIYMLTRVNKQALIVMSIQEKTTMPGAGVSNAPSAIPITTEFALHHL
jgi:hypothetical protein